MGKSNRKINSKEFSIGDSVSFNYSNHLRAKEIRKKGFLFAVAFDYSAFFARIYIVQEHREIHSNNLYFCDLKRCRMLLTEKTLER